MLTEAFFILYNKYSNNIIDIYKERIINMKTILFFIFTIFISSTIVNAECNLQSLKNNLSKGITVNLKTPKSETEVINIVNGKTTHKKISNDGIIKNVTIQTTATDNLSILTNDDFYILQGNIHISKMDNNCALNVTIKNNFFIDDNISINPFWNFNKYQSIIFEYK
jgi:hypothetical protein